MSVGVCWCMLVSIICLEHVGVPGVMFWGIKVIFRDNCAAQVSSEMCLSAQSCGNEFGKRNHNVLPMLWKIFFI